MKNILTLFFALILSVTAFASDLIHGKVSEVYDGDTIAVETDKGQIRVRLYAIDAPEKDQPYGMKATARLKRLVAGKQVDIYPVCLDKYRRYLAKVFQNDRYTNLIMVRCGLAWAYSAGKQNFEFKIAQNEAQRHNLGLWLQPNPTAPWKHRHSQAPPQILKQQQAEKSIQAEKIYWLNTKTNVRHNSHCRWYKNTKHGRMCTKNEGRACGICGG